MADRIANRRWRIPNQSYGLVYRGGILHQKQPDVSVVKVSLAPQPSDLPATNNITSSFKIIGSCATDTVVYPPDHDVEYCVLVDMQGSCDNITLQAERPEMRMIPR